MSHNNQNDVQSWLNKANENILTADRLISYEPFILDVACFHCQQAIEKYLKGYLIFQGLNIGRTHNLNFLLSQSSIYNPEINKFDLSDFTVFSVKIRYPDRSIRPKLSEVKRYYSIALEIKALVERLINE